MTNKTKNQTETYLRKNQGTKAFSISGMMDLRGIKAAIIALNSFEPEPLFIKGHYWYV
jgi:hypothetical protein